MDLYSAEHEYVFWVQIIICIQLDFVAAYIFFYFEYIQFSLHSTAADALRACAAIENIMSISFVNQQILYSLCPSTVWFELSKIYFFGFCAAVVS